MQTQHLTKALTAFTKSIFQQYQQALSGHSAPALLPATSSRQLAIGMGTLSAHLTTLEASYCEEGLHVKVLEILAEDILDQAAMLAKIPLFQRVVVGEGQSFQPKGE